MEKERGQEKSRQADRDKLKGREEFLDCSNLLVQVRYLQPAHRRGLESPPSLVAFHWRRNNFQHYLNFTTAAVVPTLQIN